MSDEAVSPAPAKTGAANQARVRAHNERLVLTLLQRHVSLSKAEIARRSGLSAQAVTIIVRALEKDGLIRRGKPVRGKVGQPSVPMSLRGDGALSLGVAIDRRTIEIALMDFEGRIRERILDTHDYPDTARTMDFVTRGVEDLSGSLSRKARGRVAGLGVAMPFELWNWADQLGVPRARMEPWKSFDVVSELRAATGLPTHLQNDGTAACNAELLLGHGSEAANYCYFHIGYFIGGGIVLNGAVVTGPSGNAGAIGTIRVQDPGGGRVPLLEEASLYLLEEAIRREGGDPNDLWTSRDDWGAFSHLVGDWVDGAACHIAQALPTIASVIEIGAVFVDGSLPATIRAKLVSRIAEALRDEDMQGIRPFEVREGSMGHDAQLLGAASLALTGRYLVDNSIAYRPPTGM